MFDLVELSDDASPASCRKLVASAGRSGQAVALLLADQPGLDLEGIVAALSDGGIPVVGGVFPALISGERLMTRGAIAFGFSAPTKRLVVRNLFESRAVIDAGVSQLLVDPRESRGHTMFVLVDGQAAGSASILLDVLSVPFQPLGADFIGGGAGYWSMGTRPCLFTEREVLPRGAGLVLRIDQRTVVQVEHGWSRLAGPFYASRTKDTIVYELDWRPAIDVYEEALASDVPGPIRGDAFPSIAMRYPLAVLKLRDALVVRDPIALTENGGLFTLGNIPENSLLAILRAEPDGLIGAASAAASTARQQVEGTLGHAPRSAFISECVSRSEALGDRFGDELRRIQREFERPIAGALTLGEVASRGERFVELYNKTVVVGAR